MFACTTLSNAGLFSGLWDGLTAVISLALSIFWDVSVYNMCHQSWFYNLGFIAGFVLAVYVGLAKFKLFIWIFLIVLVLKISLIAMSWAIWIFCVMVALAFLFALYRHLRYGDPMPNPFGRM